MYCSQEFSRLLPCLRRHARAISGSQEQGDQLVISTLEAISYRGRLPDDVSESVQIYRTLSQLWNDVAAVTKRQSSLAAQARLLQAVEGFSPLEAALVLDRQPDEISTIGLHADLAGHRAARILILEDELFVADDLESNMLRLGHQVVDVVATADAAVRAFHRHQPDLVLSDVALADGSSGLEAAGRMLQSRNLPIIFITAYPQHLLTGLRPEPTYLIEKPFSTEAVTATVTQALANHREQGGYSSTQI